MLDFECGKLDDGQRPKALWEAVQDVATTEPPGTRLWSTAQIEARQFASWYGTAESMEMIIDAVRPAVESLYSSGARLLAVRNVRFAHHFDGIEIILTGRVPDAP